jgi:hypothetical protein
MATLAEIRALLAAEQAKQDAVKSGTFTGERQPDAFLAFWNIPENADLNLRFLPDGDHNNQYFWREREMINLEFNGIKGVHTDKVRFQVPCNEMWVPKSCPILTEVRQWYAIAKDTGNEDLTKQASKYWKKKSYLFQCLVAPNSVEVKDDNAPENPIRRVLVNKDLFEKIKSILMNPDVEELPTDFEHGRDFRVIKSKNAGGFNNYDASQFKFTERPLNQDERTAVEQYGLFNLIDFMPKQPTPEELVAIKEMFEASVNGEAYDPERWAAFYRPAGVQKPATGSTVEAPTSVSAARTTTAPVAATVVESKPVVTETAQVATPAASTDAAPKEKLSPADLVAKLKAKSGN